MHLEITKGHERALAALRKETGRGDIDLIGWSLSLLLRELDLPKSADDLVREQLTDEQSIGG